MYYVFFKWLPTFPFLINQPTNHCNCQSQQHLLYIIPGNINISIEKIDGKYSKMSTVLVLGKN